MNAGVDATAWWNPRGDGRFVRNVVRPLVDLHPQDAWTLVTDERTAGRDDLPPSTRVRAVRTREDALTKDAARGPADLLRLRRATRGLDAFLSPSVYSWFPTAGVPAVVGVFDTNFVTLAEEVLPSKRARLMWSLKLKWALRSAAKVFTLSEASRRAIEQHLGLDAEQIAVVPCAPDPVFAPQPDDAVAQALEELGVDRPYLVYAAGLSPHKGVDTLLEAYGRLEDRPRLVIVGSLQGPYASAATHVEQAAKAIGGDVVLAGHVTDHALACLYTGAEAAVVPSRGEGFGLPAVEAAACGTTPVLSDIPAHRETLDGAAIFFPPGDAGALATALRGDRELAERARLRAAAMSWDDSARRLHALLVAATVPP